MGTFIVDGASVLPAVKNDVRPATGATTEWASVDANELRQAALDLRTEAIAEAAARLAADAAIIASGATPANVGIAPVTPTGAGVTDSLADWLGPVAAMLPKTPAATSVAVGTGSLDHVTTGGNNTAVGVSALHADTTGTNNVAVGSQALRANTTAYINTAVGASALANNTTGTGNTAVGVEALGTNVTGAYSVAVGYDALLAATGGPNVAVGSKSMENLTTGTGNVAVGDSTGRGVTTGSGNTVVGAGIAGLAAGLTNNVILASGGTARATFDGTSWDLPSAVTATAINGPLKASAASATVTAVLKASKLWDPGSLSTGAVASTTLTVTGAELGDACLPFSTDAIGGAILTGNVTGVDTVALYVSNWGAVPMLLGEHTYGALVIRAA
jgi:hypothetical protein